mmetsp:Transcript_2217/g.3915  ORF Transcript_2217/g.3915 Transcript_2217/m.3915 type:complete len:105 (+) Transcript_2217:1118-1432(+)
MHPYQRVVCVCCVLLLFLCGVTECRQFDICFSPNTPPFVRGTILTASQQWSNLWCSPSTLPQWCSHHSNRNSFSAVNICIEWIYLNSSQTLTSTRSPVSAWNSC